MSRNQPSSSLSKYKISSPQPFVPSQSSPFVTESTTFSSTPPSHSPAQSYAQASPAITRNGGTHGSSPARPARSRMRDQPAPPPSQPSRRNLGAIQTQNIRRTSNASAAGGYDIAASPITPASANGISPQKPGNALFTDPFATDRSQRSELRAQTSEAAQREAQPFHGGVGDKLKNVVGAFMTASKGREEPPVLRPGKSRARQAGKEEVWDVSSAEGGKFGAIDGVLGKIRKDWPFVLESDFSPSTLALSLLSQTPSTTLPTHPSLSSFLKLHDALSSSLQSAVQAHFQSFAASLPAHASFLSTLARAQQQVRTSKDALKEARDGFAGKGKSELAGVRARERVVRDMLKILDIIDNLRQIPEQLETLIGDKKFLQAALILGRSLKTINKPEIAELGAVSELRAYFVSQETTLADILVDELHSHLYLKTYYSDSRWRAYAPGQSSLPVIDLSFDAPPPIPPTPSTPPLINGDHNAVAGPSSRFSRYLSSLSVKPSEDPMLDFLDSDLGTIPDIPSHRRSGSNGIGQAASSASLASMAGGPGGAVANANPEADSYAHMETVLEALAVLGRLGSALDTVAQRVPGEIHALVETTLDEVEERSEQRRSDQDPTARPYSILIGINGDEPIGTSDVAVRRKSLFTPGEALKIAVSLIAIGPPNHAAVLRDLFWTLYSKLAAVLEGHRVIYEVARWISSRVVKANTTLSIPVLEVWKPVQQEVRTLLHNYLTDEVQGSALDRHPLMSINEILRDGKIARDKQKQMFKFADTDNRAVSNEIKLIDDSVQQALKVSVPGLVNIQSGSEGPGVLTGSMAGSDDRYSTAGRHRTLIPPNAFNVSTLFQPTLAFIERASAIAPVGFEEEPKSFSGVLEDFVVNVFLPQLDERVTASFQQAVSGYDAYQVDRTQVGESKRPPSRSSVRVMALIHSLCAMLQTTPFHRENYSRLVVGVIVQYYQQCSARFKELASLPSSNVQATEAPLALPATWAQRGDVIKCLTAIRAVASADRHELTLIGQREIKLESDLLGDKPVVASQLIHSQRKFEALGLLSQSLRWFIDSLLDLQASAEEPLSPGAAEAPDVGVVIQLSFQRSRAQLIKQFNAGPSTNVGAGDEPRLPLTRAMAQRYEAIVQTYEQLAEMVLNAMRLEIRCRVICNTGASLRSRKGDFRLDSEALEPDPDIFDLSSSLTESDELAASTLCDDDQSFVFRALSQLVDHLFIQAARSIKVINLAGVKKIKRNILSLQQTLRNVHCGSAEGVLTRSVAYWDLYESGPKNMMESIRTSKPMFSFEDYNTMLNLQCKTDQAEAPSSELNTYLIDLHALSMSIDGWETGEG